MSVVKLASGRWRAKLKSGRVDVASKAFDTRREALAWLARERAALAGGVDPRAGRERVRALVIRWLQIRRTTVAGKTYRSDQDLLRLMPTSMLALQVAAVSGREVARSYEALLARGLAEGTVRRSRASLSSFFGWCVREKMIAANPVTDVRVPRQSHVVEEMDPFTESMLEDAHAALSEASPAARGHPARAGLDRAAMGRGQGDARGRRHAGADARSDGAAVAAGGSGGQGDEGPRLTTGAAREPRAADRAAVGGGQGVERPAVHDGERRAAASHGDGAVGAVG